MHAFMQQIKKVISVLHQHFANANLDSSEITTLTPEDAIIGRKELRDQETFLDFHINIGTGFATPDHTCHCTASLHIADMLKKHKVSFAEHSCHCDCGSEFVLPAPNAQFFQEEKDVLLANLLTNWIFDCLRQSASRCNSPDKLGSGGCVCTALPLFTTNFRAHTVINDAYVL